MKKNLFLLFVVILFDNSCKDEKKMEPKTRLYHYYDFNVSLDYKYEMEGFDEKYIIRNFYNRVSEFDTIKPTLTKKTLCYIHYQYIYKDSKFRRTSEVILKKPDTIKIKLSDKQLDKIFLLAKSVFRLDTLPNLTESNTNIPLPPIPGDGPIGSFTFEYGQAGFYSAFLVIADSTDCPNRGYVNMKKFLDIIKTGYNEPAAANAGGFRR
jgi:hypothetical protein